MQLVELSQAGRTPDLPLTLQVAGEPLVLERLLRVLPGQRYVGVARWQGRPVLAKLLVGDKAQRHFLREREGAEYLAGQGLVTPRLLAQDFIDGRAAGCCSNTWRAHRASGMPGVKQLASRC
jgi:hypothetical protein